MIMISAENNLKNEAKKMTKKKNGKYDRTYAKLLVQGVDSLSLDKCLHEYIKYSEQHFVCVCMCFALEMNIVFCVIIDVTSGTAAIINPLQIQAVFRRCWILCRGEFFCFECESRSR